MATKNNSGTAMYFMNMVEFEYQLRNEDNENQTGSESFFVRKGDEIALTCNPLRNLLFMEYWRKSIRLDGWDYRFPSFYFVTICTKNRVRYFGDVRNGCMGLSQQGCAAWYFWGQIPDHFDNVKLDAFVVMPDHVHGIIQIIPDENGNNPVGALHATPLRDYGPYNKMSAISPKPGSLSTIIRSYKSALTRWCNRKHYDMAWQPRFYDHIIRNENSLEKIREYILNNPMNWDAG